MGLGLRAAARELGISHPALLKALKNGRVSKEPDGTFDVEKCRAALEQNSNVVKQRSARAQVHSYLEPQGHGGALRRNEAESADGTGGTFLDAQCAHEWLKVEEKRLALERKRGELAPVGEINAHVAGMIVRARDILLRIGPELRDRLAQESDPVKCEKMIRAEVDRALRELAKFRVE